MTIKELSIILNKEKLNTHDIVNIVSAAYDVYSVFNKTTKLKSYLDEDLVPSQFYGLNDYLKIEI